jgi:hypothetical protein
MSNSSNRPLVPLDDSAHQTLASLLETKGSVLTPSEREVLRTLRTLIKPGPFKIVSADAIVIEPRRLEPLPPNSVVTHVSGDGEYVFVGPDGTSFFDPSSGQWCDWELDPAQYEVVGR